MKMYIYFDKLSEDDCVYLAHIFDSADETERERMLSFIDTISSHKDIDSFFDVSLREQEASSFFKGNPILRIFSKIIKSSDPIEPQENTSLHYYIWNFGSSESLKDNTILCQLIDNQIDYDARCLLVTFVSDKYKQPIFVIRDNLSHKNYITYFERIFFCDNVQDFQDWLNRTRKFEHHTKHDKIKRKNNKGKEVSVLYFHPIEDILKIEKLLNEAIAENKTSSKILYNYDTENKLYIQFYAHRESVELYHAFHIEADKEHEIPPSIKNELNKKR